ncbi:hypothetical protein [Micromonospora sp. C28ISP2-4]|uniref:DUF2399 domain-containing protein n=1 Tax=Micromonospora sp. C28ISP2-4 TaxID=3059523 RepID=UPI002676D053|nr:hypothetical protein [Micromonospora sp. C28ISP2-4]MDO3686519.1 hypothetical protein [Micromonospora sp. C28ISP2-4]
MTIPGGSASDNAVPDAEPDREIVLTWITDYPGLVVYAPLPASGRYPRDRNGDPYYRSVRLRAENPGQPPRRPAGLLSDTDWAWMTRSEHAWRQVADKFGAQAETIVFALARAACVTIGYDLTGSRPAPSPKRVYPHPDLSAAEKYRRAVRRDQRSTLQSRAAELAADLRDEWPGVAQALHTTEHPDRLGWAVTAATDLTAGVVHNSVRAFVQTHAGSTKARDDVQRLLTELGFEPDALAALGLSRSPYIGIGGPVRLQVSDAVIDLSPLPGPHDIRLSPQHTISIDIRRGTGPLLIIENRQAAETLCDIDAGVPVIWCHGQPPEPVLNLIAEAAVQASSTLICTDADLGGVRIAARIHDHLAAELTVHVIDVGAARHQPGRAFSAHSRAHLEPFATRNDQIGAFARNCLDRGYAIEQEATVKAALTEALDRIRRN